MTRTLKPLALSALMLAGMTVVAVAPAPVHAAAALIKSGGTDAIPTMVTAADGSAVSGLGTAFTVTVRRPGASAYVAGLGTVSENGNGVYDYTPTAAETAAAGSRNTLLVHLVSTATATTFGDSSAQIVGFDPASDLGAAALAGITTSTTANGTAIGQVSAKLGTPVGASLSADIQTRSVYAGGPVASVTAPVVASSVTAPVTVGTNNDKAGYSGTATNFVAAPTPIQIRQEIDANSVRFTALAANLSQPILFDSGGNVKSNPQTPVTLASAQSFNNTGQTTAPAWLGNTSVLLAAEQAKLLAASTAQQAGQSVTLPGTAPTGYGGGGSGPTAADIWAYNNRSLTDKAGFRTVNSLGKYTYNPTTKVLQQLADDGTPLGSPVTLTIVSGTITSRQ